MLDAFFETSQAATCLLDRTLRIVRVNPTFIELTGLSAAAHAGRTLSEVLPDLDDPFALPRAAETVVETRRPLIDHLVTGITAVRPTRGAWLASIQVVGEPSAPGYVLSLRDARPPATEAIAEATIEALANERIVSAGAEAALRDLSFLYEVGEALAAAPIDVAQRAALMARLSVPSVADWCVVTLLDDVGDLHAVEIAHWDVERARAVGGALLGRIGVVDVDATSGFDGVIGHQRTEVDAATPPAPGLRRILDRLEARSYVIAPLVASQRAIGAVLFAFAESARRFDAVDVPLLEQLARHAATSLEGARLYAEALESTRIRDEMITMISHDVRNPLSALRLRAQLVLERAHLGRPLSAAELATTFEGIVRSIDQASEILDGALVASRIEGTIELDRDSSIDLVELVRDLVERAREHATRTGSTLELRTTQAQVVGPWDGVRVGQIVSNLLSNAIKYGAGKPISAAIDGDGVIARIVVTDHGIGIAPEQQQRVFERFGRATSAHEAQSHGLGLWIVRRLVRAMGGAIELASAPGQGSTFTVILPLARPAHASPGTPATNSSAPKVLIVDDQPELLRAMAELVEAEGYRVVTASDGAEALRTMRAGERPDLVLLDVVMPVLDGGAVYAAMRADPALAKVPVVVTTSDPARAPIGAITLRKPPDRGDLLELVRRLTRERTT